MLQDLRYALRQCRRSPGFFTVAALLIAIGIAANTQIFTFVNALLLRPLAIRNPESLVQLFELHAKRPIYPYFDYRFYRQLTASSKTLAAAAGQLDSILPLERNGVNDRVHANWITENFCEFLGIQPHLGRLIGRGDTHLVVLSHAYWQGNFAGDRSVIGQTVRLKGHPYQVAGIMPQGFNGTTIDSGPEIWIPYGDVLEFSQIPNRQLDDVPLEIIARLRPGASREQAEQETAALWDADRKAFAARNGDFGLEPARLELNFITAGRSPMRDQSRMALIFVFAGTGLVLLMVCANIGGLMLARAAARDRETAIRMAIGASTIRIIRQSWAQSLVVTGIGGAAGILAAYITMPLLVLWLPPARGVGNDPSELRTLALDLHPDLRVIAFSLALCAASALIAALAPAWRSARHDLYNSLRSGGDTGHRRFQSVLCALQIALCTVLLVSTGLFSRSLLHLRATDAGFKRDRIAIFSFEPTVAGYDNPQNWAFQQRLLDEVRALPGVENAALASRALLRGIGLGFSVVFPGGRGDGIINTSTNPVTPGYFDVMGIRLLSGRALRQEEYAVEGKPAKVIVNQAFVRRFSNNQSPLGRQFALGREFKKAAYEIVGVVNDTKYRSLREVPQPIVYAYDYGPQAFPNTFVLHVRTRTDPASLIGPVQKLVRTLDPKMPAYQASTINVEEDRSLWQERTLSGLAACFGVFAAVLVALGLYGILANFVAGRRRDIGIRLALGAASRHILLLLTVLVLPILGVGLLVGAGLSLLAGNWAKSLLYEVEATDQWSFAGSLLLVLAIAAIAALYPLRRALRVDPATTLRAD